MSSRKIVLSPEDAQACSGASAGDEVVFQVTGLLVERRKDGAVVIDVRETQGTPVGDFKEAARRARVLYVRSTIEPSVG